MKKLILNALAALLIAADCWAQGVSPDGARVPPATSLDIPTSAINKWTFGRPVLASPGNNEILRNGKLAGTGGSVLAFCQKTVFALGRDKAWWKVIREDGVSVIWERTVTLPCDEQPPTPPPPTDLCLPIATSGGKFKVGDKVSVNPATGGMNLRALPDIDTAPLAPFQPINAEGAVDCVQLVGSAQWIRVSGFKVAPFVGWARETGFDKVGPVVVIPPTPPPPPDKPIQPPPTGATYFTATTGDDANDGRSVFTPFKTIQKGCSVLKPGQVLVVRGGEYDAGPNSFTTNGSTSVCPSGNSWLEPVTIRAYPGEKPVLRRYLETSGVTNITEAQMRGGIHLATPAECAANKTPDPRTRKPAPYPCWSGGGIAPGWLSVLDVATHGYLPDAVFRIYGPSKYIIWDGIDIDGRGIVAATLQLSCNQRCNSADDYDGPTHIRFTNMEIRNSISSCTSAPGAVSEAQTDLQFIKVKIGNCGVPYDTNWYADDPKQGLARLHPNARFYHPWYMHTGGNSLIDSETYNTAGTGLSPDGDNNIITGNFIHDNASHGLLITGGKNWRVENNIFYNNRGYALNANSGQGGHRIENNTFIRGPNGWPTCILFGRGSYGEIYRRNIIDGCEVGVQNEATYPNFGYLPINVLSENIIRTTTPGREIVTATGTCPECPVPPTLSGNLIGVDPMLGANHMPLPGSPALTGNIGARR